jgi:signal transduction histidine kinase
MMLSIFLFMVLVLGLLTLNLWLDAATRARAELQRHADLVARIVSFWVRDPAAGPATWTPAEWETLFQKLSRTEVVSAWTVAADREGRPALVVSNEENPARILEEERKSFEAALSREHKIDATGARVYVPLESATGERFAARLTLKGSAIPGYDTAEAMKGIATVMVIGTAVLLLNVYMFLNRLVLRPLETLVEASGRVAEGDFSKKILETGTYDEMGRLVGAFNLMMEKIREHHRTLEEEVRLARDLVTRTERQLFAAQRLSTTGTLAAGIAHEVNNPLGGMINAARTLREGRLDEGKRAEYLELIADGLERVRTIVQQVLQFRPRAYEPQPVALREAVERAAAFLEHRARAKQVEIRNELPPDLPAVNGDPLDLQQAFLNLLKNAVDACVVGEGRISVTHRLAHGSVSVVVTDNGCGMTEEELARCLDPFFTTKDVGEGTGLGLSVAHNIVTNHGGRMELESRPGQGCTVTLTFPLPAGRTGAPETAALRGTGGAPGNAGEES